MPSSGRLPIDGDAVRGAYHRGAHGDERVRMAKWWSDKLDALRVGAEIVPITIVRGGLGS